MVRFLDLVANGAKILDNNRLRSIDCCSVCLVIMKFAQGLGVFARRHYLHTIKSWQLISEKDVQIHQKPISTSRGLQVQVQPVPIIRNLQMLIKINAILNSIILFNIFKMQKSSCETSEIRYLTQLSTSRCSLVWLLSFKRNIQVL